MALKWITFILSATVASYFLHMVHARMVTNELEIKQHIRNLFSNRRHDAQMQEKERVRNGIKTFFEGLRSNLAADLVNQTTFSIHHYLEGAKNGSNIILTIKGERYGTSADEVSLVGAHFDSVSNSPGVDDNGSGISALLEIARVLVDVVSQKRCSRINSVIVVAFDHEEDNLTGSTAYIPHLISSILQQFGVTNFQGAYIMDTLMNFDPTVNSQTYPFGFEMAFPVNYQMSQQNRHRGDTMITIARRDDAGLASLFQNHWYEIVGGNYSTTSKYRQMTVTLPFSGSTADLTWPEQSAFADFFRSDHYSFWNQKNQYTQTGLKAVFLTDTANFRGFMAQCYHNPCDDFSKVNDDRLEFLQIGAETILRSLVTLLGNTDVQCLYNQLISSATNLMFTTQLIVSASLALGLLLF